MVTRIDSGGSFKATKLPNGFLRLDATLTRTGVFTYTQPDGSKRRELRLPEEVFHPEAMASFRLMPVTDQHPPRLLDASTASSHVRGSVGEPRRDGDHLAAEMLITDAALIAKIESNAARETSCGYNCDEDETPGVHPTYGPYDVIQRRIRGNHVAVVKYGRAGTSRVRMDDADVPVLRIDADGEEDTPGKPPNNSKKPPTTENPVKNIRIDGIELDPSTPAFEQAFEKMQRAHADALKVANESKASAEKSISELQAKFDAQGEELKKAKEELKALPAKLAETAKARAALELSARKVVGEKFKLDGLDDRQVRAAVLERLVKGIKLDGKDDSYVAARFDAEVERFKADDDARTKKDPAVKKDADTDDTEEEVDEENERFDADESYDRMVKANRDAWKETVKG